MFIFGILMLLTQISALTPLTTPPPATSNVSPVPIVMGVIGGVFGLILLGTIITFVVRRYLKRKQQEILEDGNEMQVLTLPSEETSKVVENKSEETQETNTHYADEQSSKKDVEKSVSIPKNESKSVNVIHLDHTDVVVPAELKREELKALLRSMRKNVKLGAVKHPEQKAVIAKVLTYGTDDEITLGDRSSRESDSLSKSGKSKSEAESLMIKLITHGPREYQFEYDELQRLLNKATSLFAKEPSLLEVPVPCTIYGDIHGQYSDLHRWFNLNGWPHQTRSVFLGDFVDRGSHGVEVVALISCLKIVYPDKMFIVRGNHEEESLNRAYSFYEEVICRFPGDPKRPGKDGLAMYSAFKNLFMNLPLAVLIGGRVLGMHGGVSPKMESLQAIRNIKRPIDDFEVGSLECDLVWSDPDTGADTGFRPNLDREPNKGIGQLFAANTVKEACEKLNVDLIIRGHQAPLHGYALFADGLLMTLFSAPGYKGMNASDVNMGACIEFDKDMKITIKQIRVTEKFRQNRVNDAEKVRIARKEQRKKKT